MKASKSLTLGKEVASDVGVGLHNSTRTVNKLCPAVTKRGSLFAKTAHYYNKIAVPKIHTQF